MRETLLECIFFGIGFVCIIGPVVHYVYYGIKNHNINDITVLINNPWNIVFIIIGLVIFKKKVIDNNG